MGNPIDDVLASDYLDGIDRLGMAELRQRRDECHQIETGLSYFRRLIQGRLDIVHAEIARREGGGEAPDLEHLIAQLPSILAEHTGGGQARGQLPEVIAPPDVDESELDAIIDADRLSTLPELTDGAVGGLADQLTDLERTVSSRRRALHERIDALQAEIVRRYKSGEANVDALLR